MQKSLTLFKAVIDTNIFISGLISEKGKAAALINSWRKGNFVLVISPQLIDEFLKVVKRPHIKEKYNIKEKQIKGLVKTIYKKALRVKGLYEVEKSEDPKDNMFLACALEGKADYLVSFDPHLANLKYYYGVQIVSVGDFLKLLGTR
ncbi:MAG: putative toxin-antitoxin system toxin component, PIN family [bacterium]|nr:putative toxin-antitoxin system toxin component, PIN family [bacterium]